MTTITKERLLTIRQWRETYGPGSNVVLPAEEAEELARIALASLEAEPVAVNDDMAYAFHHALSDSSLGTDEVEEIKVGLRAAFANVTAQPVPVVPGEIADDLMEKLPKSDAWANGFRGGWNACRAVMLQSGNFLEIAETSTNSPVTPDSWISCSDRMPDKLIPVMVMYEDGEMWSAMWNGNRWDDGTEYPDPHSVTHWREMPAEPPQEVNRG